MLERYDNSIIAKKTDIPIIIKVSDKSPFTLMDYLIRYFVGFTKWTTCFVIDLFIPTVVVHPVITYSRSSATAIGSNYSAFPAVTSSWH